MEATTALAAPAHAQNPTALTAAHTPPAVPVHIAQAAQSVEIAVAALPAIDVTAPETAPPAAPATAPAVVDPVQDVAGDVTVDDNGQTSASIDLEAEARLSAQITRLYVEQRNGKASMKRTRAELRALKLELSAKLHLMKSMLVGTGRGGGWASYLRAQHLPLSSADRLVAEHEATLAPTTKKVLTEDIPKARIEEVQVMARKMAAKLNGILTSQELLYAFARELVWNIEVAEAWYTDSGFEIPKIGSDDAPCVDVPVAELADPAPAA
ncbi:MAG: hypothetical protein M3O31_16020 [Acidobacteriota bacterium]|nr:hypothetical protein [Acidobacteriota bacterium]